MAQFAVPYEKKVKNRTHFQIYRVHVRSRRLIIHDFTEQKLLRLIAQSEEGDRNKYLSLLADYRRGHIAIAWDGGKPVFTRLHR